MTDQAITTDYRARRYLVRTALANWLATLPASGHATHSMSCPACGATLHLERFPLGLSEDIMATAKCSSSTCVNVY